MMKLILSLTLIWTLSVTDSLTMMKLILSLTLIWTLSSTAEALECWQGLEVDTWGNESFPYFLLSYDSNELCATVAAQENMDGYFTQYNRSLCLPSSHFSEGEHIFSLNVGFGNISASVHVCNTDGCNNQTIPYPDVQEKNNLTCFVCDDRYSAVCNQTVQCVGVEDRCFSMTANYYWNPFQILGCVSANLCEDFSGFELLPGLTLIFFRAPKCCEGSFCNSAWSVKLNVNTLLFGLITLIFY